MDRVRLTRAERRDATRERLLGAARAILAEKGYAAASVEDIAAAAGHTRGAFYSNFGGKADVLFELLRRDRDEAAAALRRIVGSPDPADDAQRAMLAYWRRGATQRAVHLMWLDAQLQAARDPRFRARFGALLRDRQTLAAACIDAYAARAGVSLPLPTRVLALGLIALCDGMQSHGAVDALADAVLVGFITHTVFDHLRG
ncbi:MULTISPECIES: TetR/AcrR family transcriptional regulator [Burkholderia]|uniref:TetR/AcrR family transcriptional regulator n=1 Tax=Burkholderia TaxID=32008 RepID=UPI00073A585A|nr:MULTISPECIES: TetR/AcrR family transcriptional regulator [Burkholderia]ALV58512.1 TetR family transcriptional regulator [Burkholderia cenocepacia]AMU12328.1 TetR family transcriptional regulator [Burkholderia cenocepacia]AQQ22164.1 TetR family transcriptional regulator [Burkholderia cenocepacia]AQQ45293.1 TetR family transcriptional regulator [Burkholderia cenocepacia]MBG0871677.1 TetR/AcrR family transcriptional regulator [Burkholderia sp. 9777_1386]